MPPSSIFPNPKSHQNVMNHRLPSVSPMSQSQFFLPRCFIKNRFIYTKIQLYIIPNAFTTSPARYPILCDVVIPPPTTTPSNHNTLLLAKKIYPAITWELLPILPNPPPYLTHQKTSSPPTFIIYIYIQHSNHTPPPGSTTDVFGEVKLIRTYGFEGSGGDSGL